MCTNNSCGQYPLLTYPGNYGYYYHPWSLSDVTLRPAYDWSSYHVINRTCDSYATCLPANNQYVILDTRDCQNCPTSNRNSTPQEPLSCPSGMSKVQLKTQDGQELHMCKFDK
jgi:hypothetical protein